MKFIEKAKKLPDIFTKPLPKDRFFLLRNVLGIIDSRTLS